MPKFKSLLVDSSDEDEPPEPNGSSLHKNLKKRKKVWEDSSDDEVDFPADRTVQLLQPSNILPSSGFCLNSDGGGSGWVCARGRGSSLRKKPIGKEKEEHIVSVELSEENDESDESVSGGKDVLEHQRRTGPCTNGSSIMESQYQYTRPESPQERNEVDRTSPTDIKSESCWLERRAPLSQSSCSLRLKLGRGEASLASCTALREGKTSHSQPIDSPDTSPLASYKPSAIPMPPPQYEQAAGLQSPPSNRLKTAIVTASKRRACNHDVWSTENLLHSDVYSEEDADGDSDSNIDSDETKFQDSSQTRCPVVPVAEWWVPPKELATTERQVETSSTGAISWPDEADGSPLPTEEWIMKGQRPDLYGWLESRGFVDSAPTALSAGSPPCTDKKLANACMTAAQEGRLSVLRWLSRLPNFDSLSLFRNNCSEFAPNQSIVFEAARNGHIEVLRWLARTLGGGDLTTHINKPSVDYGRGGAQGRKMLLQAERERTWVSTNEGGGFFPLLMAAWNGHLPVVRWLFVHGATLSDVCFLGRTPIFYARTQGHFDVVRWLLLNGGASKCLRTRNDRSSDSPYVDDALVRSGFYEDIDSGGADDSAVVSFVMCIQLSQTLLCIGYVFIFSVIEYRLRII